MPNFYYYPIGMPMPGQTHVVSIFAPKTKHFYFTPSYFDEIHLSITAPSVFATTTIVIDSNVKDSISFTPELVITKVCDEGVYEYGYNGQLKDNEWSGNGNHNTALFWEYDTRIGRRGNLDPKGNPSISLYATFENNPILFQDPLGDIIKVEGSASFVDRYNKAASHLKKVGAGKAIIRLEKSADLYVISEYSDLNSTFTPNSKDVGGGKFVYQPGGHIIWNPNLEGYTYNFYHFEPEEVLNHELGHAYNYDKSKREYLERRNNNSIKNPKMMVWDNEEEKFNIEGFEQETARALGKLKKGEFTRHDHRMLGNIFNFHWDAPMPVINELRSFMFGEKRSIPELKNRFNLDYSGKWKKKGNKYYK